MSHCPLHTPTWCSLLPSYFCKPKCALSSSATGTGQHQKCLECHLLFPVYMTGKMLWLSVYMYYIQIKLIDSGWGLSKVLSKWQMLKLWKMIADGHMWEARGCSSFRHVTRALKWGPVLISASANKLCCLFLNRNTGNTPVVVSITCTLRSPLNRSPHWGTLGILEKRGLEGRTFEGDQGLGKQLMGRLVLYKVLATWICF